MTVTPSDKCCITVTVCQSVAVVLKVSISDNDRIYTCHKLSVYNLLRMKSRRGAAPVGFDPPKIVYEALGDYGPI